MGLTKRLFEDSQIIPDCYCYVCQKPVGREDTENYTQCDCCSRVCCETCECEEDALVIISIPRCGKQFFCQHCYDVQQG